MINEVHHEKLSRRTGPHAIPAVVHAVLLVTATRPSIAYRITWIIRPNTIVVAFVDAQGIQNLSVARVMITQLHSRSKAFHEFKTVFSASLR